MLTIDSTTRLAMVACIAILGCKSSPPQVAAATSASPPPASVRTIRSQALPEMNGKRLEVKLLEVSYPPSGASRAHSHPCAVFGYVLEGTLRSQVRGDTVATYRAGETFYEPPNGVHAVSANASTTEPVRFLATFVCDSDAPLSTPVPER
jgi:quercetin dioxygenase-like cupin family protein